jgi:thymidylate kinase
MAADLLGPRRGRLISMEGVWGAGKTTNARRLAADLTAQGFTVVVLHHGLDDAFNSRLSVQLDQHPLRRRDGDGGFDRPHHATIDVLLRLCREAYHHIHQYEPALATHDVVILDRGLYTKLAYALTVLSEQHPATPLEDLLGRWRAIATPWLIEPNCAFFLDLPWVQARDRAVARSRSRGVANPKSGSRERELFLPHYDATLRWVVDRHPDQIVRIPAENHDLDEVFAAITAHSSDLLHIPALDGCNP